MGEGKGSPIPSKRMVIKKMEKYRVSITLSKSNLLKLSYSPKDATYMMKSQEVETDKF